jgi:cyclohexyl-isocyanide hydratase
MTIADCPALDVLLVPGGPGQVDAMDDELVLDFLRRQGSQASYVTSVCTGSLLLGAAGLLDGYSAACHWMSRDQLEALGARPSGERVAIDRNRITGGGVTAGIDFGLALAALLRGRHEAERIQLQLEYNPAPPFSAGSPESAGPELEEEVRRGAEGMLSARRAATLRAKARLAK